MHILEELLAGQLKGTKKLQLPAGLKVFPREIFELADTLEVLDLSGNRLTELPADFGRLHKLKIAFFSSNCFEVFPKVLADCESLTMIGFKSNTISVFPENALPLKTRWLILTDNKIETLPRSLGNCVYLQKVMLAGNRIKELPQTMAACRRLELLRISANLLVSIPQWLLELPRLSWLGFSGNPCSHKLQNFGTRQIFWTDLELKQQLGEGASGIISKAQLKSAGMESEVAVKIFKGEVTSDGYPEDELNTCLSVGHNPYLVPLLGQIDGHTEGKKGIVMELLPPFYTNLGNPPSLDSCTRDTYPDNLLFPFSKTINIAHSVASAAKHLHEKGVLHGDLYAHNTMIEPAGKALLGDFGAATGYDKQSATAPYLERLDVRAFGCMLEELLGRAVPDSFAEPTMASLNRLKDLCFNETVLDRPSFSFLVENLALLLPVKQ